ncbi:MAG: MoaD family protein [Methanomassiliicoccales archaeon]|nr:MoaD family protein [Methanomassiliicoccales archaeon]
MKVRVKMFANLQEISGTSEVFLDAETVLSALDQLVRMFEGLKPEIFEDYERKQLMARIKIMVNGTSIDYIDGLKTVLREGDRVAVFPILAGG